MIAGKSCLLAVLSGTLFCAGCAISPEAEDRRRAVEADIEAILSEPLDTERFGTTRRCLAGHEYRSFRAIDDRRVLFESRRGQLWLNTLRVRCLDLRDATVLRVKSISMFGRICEMDSFEAGDWFTWPWYRRWPWHWGASWSTGMTCSLGKFQPVTPDQVDAIEAAIRSK